MLTLLWIWAALLAALVVLAIGKRRDIGPLTLAYFLGLSLIHIPGVLVYLGRNGLLPNADETMRGFQMTLVGMAAFVLGAVIAARAFKQEAGFTAVFPLARGQIFEIVGWRLLGMGTFAYFVLVPLSFAISSLTAPVASLGTLLVIGIWLRLYAANAAEDHLRTLGNLALIPLLPFATVVTGGFISYGTYWALSVAAFLFVISRQRLSFYLALLPVIYLGLSLFVTYMGERVAIREVVRQDSSWSERLARVTPIITGFQFLDLQNPNHSVYLDERLNQNWLVGAGIFRHEDGLTDLAYGGTIPWWAPIPRVIWPDKPVVGGGGNIVADYTGIDFGTETSVGVGQVLEFYINFGLPGVVVGFVALGFILIWLDRGLMGALSRGDLGEVLLWAMPGLNLLKPGGNLLEIVVGTLTAFMVAYCLNYFRFLGAILTPGVTAGPRRA